MWGKRVDRNKGLVFIIFLRERMVYRRKGIFKWGFRRYIGWYIGGRELKVIEKQRGRVTEEREGSHIYIS